MDVDAFCLLPAGRSNRARPERGPSGEDEDVVTGRAKRDSDDGLLAFGLVYGGYTGAEMGWLLGEASERSEDAHKTAGLWPGLLGGSVVGLSTTLILDRSRSGASRCRTCGRASR